MTDAWVERSPAPEAVAIKIQDLTVNYGRRRAVDRSSMTVPRGAVYGFLGPNGAGKTSTIKTLMGFRKSDGGSAKVLGYDVVEESIEVRARAGFASEIDSLYEGMTVTITAGNGGPDEATGVVVSADVPAGARPESAKLVVGTSERDCPQNAGGSVEREIETLRVGERATLTMVIRPTLVGPLHTVAHADAENRGVGLEQRFETFVLAPERCTIAGSEHADVLVGTPRRDVICTFGDNDVIYAGAGRNLVHGVKGGDRIYGGIGEDHFAGGPGPDRLTGIDEDDALRARDGVNGNDEVHGGNGRDAISADPGDRRGD